LRRQDFLTGIGEDPPAIFPIPVSALPCNRFGLTSLYDAIINVPFFFLLLIMNVAVYDSKPYDREYLPPAGPGLKWHFFDFRLNAETAATAAGCKVVCAFVNDQLDRACLEALSKQGIDYVALRCAGYNQVDVDAAREFGIKVTRVPAYSPHAVAEHAVALLLTLNRKIHRAYNRVREHNFALGGLVGFDVAGKTVGIMGTGKIGRIAAQIFRGFDCRVLAHDAHPDPEWAGRHSVNYAPLEELLAASDIVSLHLPLTPDTHHLINQKSLDAMKPGAYLINTSRGKLIDTRALIAALKKGRLGGVALDVYEEEEGIFFEDLSGQLLKDDELTRLLTFPNVLVTAHQAFLTREALTEIAKVTVRNINLFLEGKNFIQGTELIINK
jgi:D-lactate dehydrogenase